MNNEQRAVFLDKDGTLIEDVPYNVDPEKIRLLPGVRDGLRRFQQAGYLLVVVSNQSGVARGYFPEAALAPVELRLRNLLSEAGIPLAPFYFCPHHPDGTVLEFSVPCGCRKPMPGMLLQAARELSINLGRSWMIGDSASDVEAGRRAGCRTIRIRPGGADAGDRIQADHWATDVGEAAELILARRKQAG